MPVRIESYQEMSPEEFERLPKPTPPTAVDPVWEELLDKLERGVPQRIPVDETSVRGLRLALGRRAVKRGFKVELRYGDGFLAVRKSGQLVVAPQEPKEPPTNGRRKRRKTGEEIAA